MNHSSLHGGPVRGPASSQWGSQDARSNLAVQPAANAGNFKLKKNAVKIIGAASSVPSVPNKTSGPSTPTVVSPVPALVNTKPKEADGPFIDKVAAKSISPHDDTTAQRDEAESIIDTLFARLTTKDLTTSPVEKIISPILPDKAVFTFDDLQNTNKTLPETFQSNTVDFPLHSCKPDSPKNVITDTPREKKPDQAKTVDLPKGFKNMKVDTQPSRKDLENEYMRKAGEYVNALPGVKGTTAYTFKLVSQKLHTSYVPDIKLDADEVEKLKKRYVFAITNYVNRVLKKGAAPLTQDMVKQILKDNDGNFLTLCAMLIEGNYITLKDINEVTGLCNAILDILPKAEPPTTTSVKPITPATSTPTGEETELVAGDSTANLKAWPTQEKRENVAAHRTCVLKGVGGINSINQLQALVWGGRLESISMPEPGSDFALVRFLTPEACQTYFEATENGIEIAGAKSKIMFVEKTAGPNSINDVIQNCIEGDITRCVRAVGADDDWSDMVLLNLARGKSQMKREIDRIKRGKTVRGHNFVEFRFANIYHALNFRRQLMDDQDWEHCNIGYAPDPCETARGVHYQDQEGGTSHM